MDWRERFADCADNQEGPTQSEVSESAFPNFVKEGNVVETPGPCPLLQVHQSDQSSFGLAIPETPLRTLEFIQGMAANPTIGCRGHNSGPQFRQVDERMFLGNKSLPCVSRQKEAGSTIVE